MRRTVAFLFAALALAALCGCGAKPAVTSAALTEREKALLSAQSEQCFVFDYSAGEWQWASLWAEEYRKGEKAGTYELSAWSLDMDDKGTIVLYIPRTNGEDSKQLNLTVMQGGAIYSRADVIQEFGEIYNEGGVAWQTCPSGDIPESGKKVLLCIRCCPNGFSPLGDLFIDYEAGLEELADDEASYIIGVTFSGEQPK